MYTQLLIHFDRAIVQIDGLILYTNCNLLSYANETFKYSCDLHNADTNSQVLKANLPSLQSLITRWYWNETCFEDCHNNTTTHNTDRTSLTTE